MIIKTRIVFKNDEAAELNEAMGKKIHPDQASDDFEFDLHDVNGIMPDKDPKRSIIFLQGADLLIEMPYRELREKWGKAKTIPPPDRPVENW